MNRETAIQLWQEVTMHTYVVTGRALEEFANRIAEQAVAEEREACAKTCEDLWQEEATAAANGTQEPKYHDCIECAHAIRERSNAALRGAEPALSAERPVDRRVGRHGREE